MSDVPYQVVIGLEVHVQLQTRTKLFCRCSTKFGEPPNTQVCPVCLGMPGVLPVMNRRAFELALLTAVALNCQIAEFTKWDRKNYYYPDLPKGYQISQYDLPFSSEGYLDVADPASPGQTRRIGIIRAHLEEDAGKSMHDEVAGAADSRIDLNRTGTPLAEIVSKPDLRSAAEAKAYLDELKLLLSYLDVSDCNMQEGSLRVDANINLHIDEKEGKVATPIVEVKNMNSFRAVEKAMEYEAVRQWEVWQETRQKIGDVPKQTRGWDDVAEVTRAQRHKEESSDYRYFPEPDLVPVTVTEEQVNAVKAEMGDPPSVVRAQLAKDYSLSEYDVDVLVNQGQAVVAYYRDLADAAGDPKAASNWVQQDVLRTMKERQIDIEEFPVAAAALASLLKAIKAGEVDVTRAREAVLPRMIETGESAGESMKALGIEAVDDSAMEALCRELLEANPKILADLKAGVQKAAGALIGQAKKRDKNINAGRFRELCLELAESM